MEFDAHAGRNNSTCLPAGVIQGKETYLDDGRQGDNSHGHELRDSQLVCNHLLMWRQRGLIQNRRPSDLHVCVIYAHPKLIPDHLPSSSGQPPIQFDNLPNFQPAPIMFRVGAGQEDRYC